jgi:hypothetical protein
VGANFVYAMENVLNVYERAYDSDYPVINLDESPKQLIGQIRKEFMDSKGIIHEDYQYERKGVVDIYMIAEALAGRREVIIKDNHNAKTYAKVIAYIAEQMYPDAIKITIVEDNLAAHKLAALYEVYSPQRARAIVNRLEIVRTPRHGSWLNIAENELSILIKHGLKNRIDSKEELIKQVQAWYKYRNEKVAKVNWQFTTEKARIKLKKLYPSFHN